MPKFNDISQLLCAARKKLGLSQEEFALALGIKLSRLQKWESGVNEPRFTVSELRRLRGMNRQVFDAMISGFLLLNPPSFTELLSRSVQSNPVGSVTDRVNAKRNDVSADNSPVKERVGKKSMPR